MEQKVGIHGFGQGGLEGLHQLVGQITDETNRIRQGYGGLSLLKPHTAGGGVQCGEQLICRVRAGLDE